MVIEFPFINFHIHTSIIENDKQTTIYDFE